MCKKEETIMDKVKFKKKSVVKEKHLIELESNQEVMKIKEKFKKKIKQERVHVLTIQERMVEKIERKEIV